jgi:cobalt-zinc-cadmium efflux system protein
MTTHNHTDAAESRHHRVSWAFGIGVAINLAFVVGEATAGLWFGSLALLADAGHNLSDVASLLLAWGAAALARRAPSPMRTYGFGRATILAALVNALALLIAVGAIGWEAIQRLLADHRAASGEILMAVAGIGILVNGVTTLLFARDRHRDLNLKGAFQHMAADTAVSAGVVVSGLAMTMTGWSWIDPAVSLAIVILIAVATWGLVRSSVHLAMDGVPESVDRAGVERFLRSLKGVADLHDLHIWALSTTKVALTAHLVMPDGVGDDCFLDRVAHDLEDRFGIAHTTIQIERGDGPECRLAPAGIA